MVNEYLGKDILSNVDIRFSNNQDFATITYEENLKQAIIHRLKTNKGELYNTEYGSELYKCIGQPMNNLLRNRMIGFIGEALRQEPRISEINKIEVEFNQTDAYADIGLSIVPINQNVILNLIFPYFLQ